MVQFSNRALFGLMAIHLGLASGFLSASNNAWFARTGLFASSEEDLPCCPSANFPLEFFKTPGNDQTPHNFGPASPLDQVLFTARQPGIADEDGQIKADTVQEWIDYLLGQGVINVITLLSDDELAIYEKPGLPAMLEKAGMKCFVSPMGDLGACDRVFAVVREAEAKGEKVACHCTGGVGRAGRVAAAWLVHRYSLTPEVATLIVLDQAYESGVKRLGHTEKLSGWLNSTAVPCC